MPQDVPALLALLALSATRTLAAPMDMQLGILHVGGEPDTPSEPPTPDSMDPPSSPPARPTDVMLEPSSPPTIQDSPAKSDSYPNADTTTNEPCTDCADPIPVSMSMPSPQVDQPMPVMIQHNILGALRSASVPSITYQALQKPLICLLLHSNICLHLPQTNLRSPIPTSTTLPTTRTNPRPRKT